MAWLIGQYANHVKLEGLKTATQEAKPVIEEDRDLRCNSGASRGRTSKIGGASRRRGGKGIEGIERG